MKAFARTLSAIAIACTATAAQAYGEYVGPTDNPLANQVGYAPHPTTNSFDTGGYGVFDFSSSPAPSIGYTPDAVPLGSLTETAVGTMRYSFTIYGGVGEVVPVNFNGRVELQTGGFIDQNNFLTNGLGASFVIAASKTNYASGMFAVGGAIRQAALGDWQPNAHSQNWTFTGSAGSAPGVVDYSFAEQFSFNGNANLVEATPMQYNWLAGSFTGTLLMTIGANGQATGNVGLVLMGSNVVQQAGAQFVLGGGYIDPYLSIDPTYLKSHPTVSLNVEQGVGNIAPVPEPETYAMLLAGLGLMGGIARRRAAKQA